MVSFMGGSRSVDRAGSDCGFRGTACLGKAGARSTIGALVASDFEAETQPHALPPRMPRALDAADRARPRLALQRLPRHGLPDAHLAFPRLPAPPADDARLRLRDA